MGLIILGGIIIFLFIVVAGFLLVYFIVAKVTNVLLRNKSEHFRKICVVLSNAVLFFIVYLIVLPRVLSHNDIGDIYLNGAFLFGVGVVLFFLILFYWFIARQTQGNKPSLLSLEIPAILPIFLIFIYIFFLNLIYPYSPLANKSLFLCNIITDPHISNRCIESYISHSNVSIELKVDYCKEKMKTIKERNRCYSMLAWTGNTEEINNRPIGERIKLCQKIEDDPGAYGSCLDMVVRWDKDAKDEKICEEIKTGGIGDKGGKEGGRFCYTTVAMNTKNIKLCDKIGHGSYEEGDARDCAIKTAAFNNNCGDMNFIEYISRDENLIGACFEEALRFYYDDSPASVVCDKAGNFSKLCWEQAEQFDRK